MTMWSQQAKILTSMIEARGKYYLILQLYLKIKWTPDDKMKTNCRIKSSLLAYVKSERVKPGGAQFLYGIIERQKKIGQLLLRKDFSEVSLFY